MISKRRRNAPSDLSAEYGANYHDAMPNDRHLFIPGELLFFTANLADRRTKPLTANIGALRAAHGFVARGRAPLGER